MLAPNILLQNRYRIIRAIGRGGMGTVYEAMDTRLQSRVALKETLLTDKVSRRAFEREAQLLAQLRHPVLPKVIDHFSENAGQFLVMEYISGDDLATLMEKRGGKFPLMGIYPWVLHWADQLLDALDYLHGQEPPVFHRDIKPQNLKLTQRGDIILLDFGLAKGGLMEAATVTARGEKLLGFTPNYAPLEQIRGNDPDQRSDLYSLAATLYHLLTGAKPPDALTRVAALLNDQVDPLRPAHELNPHVSAGVAAVLNRTLSGHIEERPQTAAEMRRALYAARQNTPQDDESVAIPAPTDMGVMASAPTISASSSVLAAHAFDDEHMSTSTRSLFDGASAHAADTPSDALISTPLSEPGALLRTFQTGRPVLSMAFSPDGRYLAIGSDDHTISIWAFRGGECELLHTLEGHTGRVSCVAFSPDSHTLASGGEDKTVRLWSTGEGALLYTSGDYSDPIESVKFSPDGHTLVVGGWCNAIFICQVQDNTLLDVTELSAGFVHTLAFSPDGHTLAAGCYDTTIPLWRVDERRTVRVLSGHANFVLSVAFTPNGKLLASGGGEMGIYIWRLADGRLLDTFRGHTNFVRSLAFSPDGMVLASGSEDRTVRVWQVSDGTVLHELNGHKEGVTCVAFSPDGRLLVSGSRDTKIRLWQI